MSEKKVPKIEKFYECKKCNYTTSRNSQYQRHLLTAKHKKTENTTKYNKKSSNICECGKTYYHRASLYNHKKKCSFRVELKFDAKNSGEQILNLMKDNNTITETLLNENVELRKQIGELIPKVGNSTNIKQKFNINMFLNDKCKDALNINDFINMIDIGVDQLTITKNQGIVEGLSTAIVENINKLPLYERPVHCTDVKRETLYIKDDNIWERDNSKDKLKKAIKDISTKQFKALHQWTKENPDFSEDEIKQEYFTRTLSAIGKTTDNVNDKIIKNLCNETYLRDK